VCLAGWAVRARLAQRSATECQGWNERTYPARIIWLRMRRAELNVHRRAPVKAEFKARTQTVAATVRKRENAGRRIIFMA